MFYVDSSVRFLTPFSDQHYQQARLTGGFLFNTNTGHSTFAVTHPDVYDYLPSNITALQVFDQFEGGDVLVYRTEQICKHVITPLVMCLLNPKCAKPKARLSCAIKARDVYANCHRFDQSVMNILVQNHVGYNGSISAHALPKTLVVLRNGGKDKNPDKPQICKP